VSREAHTLLGRLERAKLNHMKMEADPFYQTLFLVFKIPMMDKVPKPRSSE
jgi:hypothetical protein